MFHFFKSKRDKHDRAIFTAAEYEDWPTVFAFLDQGYPVNYPDPDTNITLLELADKQRNIAIIDALKEFYDAVDRETLRQKEADAEISSITSQIQGTSIHWQSPQPTKKPVFIAPIKPQVTYTHQLNLLTQQVNEITLLPAKDGARRIANGQAAPHSRKKV